MIKSEMSPVFFQDFTDGNIKFLRLAPVVAVVSFSFGIKHSYNVITNPVQVKIINTSLTPITI